VGEKKEKHGSIEATRLFPYLSFSDFFPAEREEIGKYKYRKDDKITFRSSNVKGQKHR
jgi:hypothetical protein